MPFLFYLQPNAAGDVFLRLFKKVWRKEVTLNVTDDSPVSIRGFKGDYTLNVKQNDVTLKTEMFTLGSSGVDVTIDLSVGSGM